MSGIDEIQAPPIRPSQPAKRGLLRKLGLTAAGVVLLLIGVGIGAAASGNQAKVNRLQAQLSTADAKLQTARSQEATDRSQVAKDRSQVATAQANEATAKVNEQNAQAIANRKAAATYASKLAAVTALQRTLDRQEGIVQANTISQDGVYVVGQDIKPGTYHTSGNGGGILNQCYYATLSSTNTGDIIDNNNFNGPETVDVSGAYAFQIAGGCTWTLEVTSP
jgi:multidrug efflux pump subunit AcrA (membrane-fusion protein)